MKSIIQEIAKNNKEEREALAAQNRQQEIDHPGTNSDSNRRRFPFLKKTALGGNVAHRKLRWGFPLKTPSHKLHPRSKENRSLLI